MPNPIIARRVLLGAPVVVIAAATTTLDPSNKDSDIALSNGNLTATQGGGFNFHAVRSIASRSTGKFYCEFSPTTIGNQSVVQFGIVNGSFGLTGNDLGGGTTSCGFLSNGLTKINGSTIGTGTGWNAGDTIGMAVDLTNSTIWFRQNALNWNNNGSADPATNTGGFSLSTLAAAPYYVGFALASNGDVTTVNFGATAYAQTAPSGFGNW